MTENPYVTVAHSGERNGTPFRFIPHHSGKIKGVAEYAFHRSLSSRDDAKEVTELSSRPIQEVRVGLTKSLFPMETRRGDVNSAPLVLGMITKPFLKNYGQR